MMHNFIHLAQISFEIQMHISSYLHTGPVSYIVNESKAASILSSQSPKPDPLLYVNGTTIHQPSQVRKLVLFFLVPPFIS